MDTPRDQVFYGWFDAPDETVPSYEPPRDGPCLFCGHALFAEDVRTHSIMTAAPEYAQRSYFYRTHRTCAEAYAPMDDAVWAMIVRNGD